MKSYKSFMGEAKASPSSSSVAFSYSDGGEKQIVVITGSESDITKVQNKLSSSTKILDAGDYSADDDDVWRISAKEWLKIQ